MRDSNARLDIQIDATVKRLAEDGYRDPLGEAKELRKYHRAFSKPRNGLTKDGTMIYFARKHDCEACALKPKCCPNGPARKIARSVYEAARDKVRAIAKTEAYAVSCRERKKVEMLFGHLKRILRLGRLRLRGPSGAKDVPIGRHRPKPEETGKAHPPSDAGLRHIRRRGPALPCSQHSDAHQRTRAKDVFQRNRRKAAVAATADVALQLAESCRSRRQRR